MITLNITINVKVQPNPKIHNEIEMATLTLKWSRYWALPLVVKGVPMDPNSENAFPEGIF